MKFGLKRAASPSCLGIIVPTHEPTFQTRCLDRNSCPESSSLLPLSQSKTIFVSCSFLSIRDRNFLFSDHILSFLEEKDRKILEIINAEGRSLTRVTARPQLLKADTGNSQESSLHRPRLCSASEQNNDGRKLNNFNPGH